MGRMGHSGTSGGFWLLRLALGVLLLLAVQGVHCEHEPTESECRPYIERALKEHHGDVEEDTREPLDTDASSIEQEENPPIDEAVESNEEQTSGETKSEEDGAVGNATTESSSTELEQAAEGAEVEAETNEDTGESVESPEGEEENKTEEQNDTAEQSGNDSGDGEGTKEETGETEEVAQADQATQDESSQESDTAEAEGGSQEAEEESKEGDTAEGEGSQESATAETDGGNKSDVKEPQEGNQERDTADVEGGSQEHDTAEVKGGSEEGDTAEVVDGSQENGTAEAEEGSQEGDTAEVDNDSQEGDTAEENGSKEGDTNETEADTAEETAEADDDAKEVDTESPQQKEETNESEGKGDEEDSTSKSDEVTAEEKEDTTEDTTEQSDNATTIEIETTKGEAQPAEAGSQEATVTSQEENQESLNQTQESAEGSPEESAQEVPEEDLTKEMIIPDNLRSRDHIIQILKLDEESVEKESALAKTIDNTLKTLKNIYDNAIKPLEILYKYRDLSNRHFGDPEIFSKPLILFMGPWSGGKSSSINYLLDLEFKELALRTGAEPSPAYFNILTYGEETEILDGTQLAADWTFSGLQKFGQGLLDRLRGVRTPNRLLEKVNIVEIPGILEIRKQVQRLFPFNDACQWFIDRADIIFLVYDPAKLDVGPETEAILDQLKGREYQTRIILNKADQVKPEELMRVQGTLIWNISPLMSSQEPPVMYTTSLWSLPYEASAPARLLLAQERAFLRDLREAIDKRVENKIASARRFAVRVRNHAKMVDCYLTTYYNHKTFFGNRKKTSDDIIENPQKYHIYEGLSTLTNISRYDLPDPEMYRDFFRINPLFDFTKLSDTCTYFRGCPINKLDIAIAYDLPELVGKYKKAVEAAKPKS